ncbi:MAG: hypothetical protein DRJ01_14815, partial [Bacteroidetes bacterium]
EYESMPYSKCTKCENFFWFEDCRKITDYEIREHINPPKKEFVEKRLVTEFIKENLEDYQENKLDLNYPPVNWSWRSFAGNLIEDFNEILESVDRLSIDKEVYIRITLWQHINDFIRHSRGRLIPILKINSKESKQNRKIYDQYEKIRLENLKRLSDLLTNVKGEEYEGSEITLIEIERELGNFEKAKSLIENIDPIDEHKHKVFIKKSLKLIAKRSTKIFRL